MGFFTEGFSDLPSFTIFLDRYLGSKVVRGVHIPAELDMAYFIEDIVFPHSQPSQILRTTNFIPRDKENLFFPSSDPQKKFMMVASMVKAILAGRQMHDME